LFQTPSRFSGYDAVGLVAEADQFHVAFLDQPDVLAGRQPPRRRDRGDGDVDGVAPPVAVLNQVAKARLLFHR
jgi:hypothetical protein